MDLTLNGTVVNILQEQHINTKKGEIVKYSFVVDTNDTYKKNIVFCVYGEDRWRNMNLSVGSQVQIYFDLSSREWNGKWFTEAQAWRVSLLSSNSTQPQQQQQPVAQVSQPQLKSDDDIPF